MIKQIIFIGLFVTQVLTFITGTSAALADEINLGGLLKVDKDGNVQMGTGEHQIKVEGGNVDIGTTGAKIEVDGGDVNLEAGNNKIDVEGGNVDINSGSSNVEVKDSGSVDGVSGTTGRLISDGVFFDNNGNAIEVKSGNFSRLELSGLDLSNYDLKGADFSRSILEGINFSGADLSGADFSRAQLINVNFSGADLTAVDLTRARFNQVNFSNVSIVGSSFERSDFVDTDFSNATVRGTCFRRNEFQNVLIVNVDLTDSSFSKYDFSNVDFSGTNKGVAVWNADDCNGIADYAKTASVEISTGVSSGTAVIVAKREPLIQASSIVKELSKGKGEKIDLTVNFRTDSDQLHGNAHAQVSEIAKALKSSSLNGVNVMIAGHTDSDGTNDYNIDLSYRRASTVQRVLVNDYGVELNLLTIRGFGEESPVANNASPDGRSLNRRVTLVRL
ncbi:MAG: OmpA family protein [Arenicella sp.]